MAQEDYQHCLKICVSPNGRIEDPCCEPACCLKKIGILVPSDNSSEPAVDASRISYSFLLSVGGDIGWQPVINQSVRRCFDQVENTPVQYEYEDCPGMPTILNKIVNCCYKENFLRCARWNQSNEDCVFAYKYVENDC